LAKRWQKAELAYLKRNAATQSPEDLARRFHTDTATVTAKLDDLGLGEDHAETASDPDIARYEAALRLLHDRKWVEAAAAFETLGETTVSRRLRALAQQHLAASRRMIEDEQAVDDADPYLKAVLLKNRGAYDEALALCSSATDDNERMAFLAASVQALRGETEPALALLEDAIRLEPKNRVHAFHDPDFNALRQLDAFQALLARD